MNLKDSGSFVKEAPRSLPHRFNCFCVLAAFCGTRCVAQIEGLRQAETLIRQGRLDRHRWRFAPRRTSNLPINCRPKATRTAPPWVGCMRAKDFSKAIDSLPKQMTERQDDCTLQFFLRQDLMRWGAAHGDPAFAEAKAALQTSVKSNPRNCRFAGRTGQSGRQGVSRLDDAQLHLEQARLLDPKDKGACSSPSNRLSAERTTGACRCQADGLEAIERRVAHGSTGTSSRIRLNILSSSAQTEIREFQTFHSAATHAFDLATDQDYGVGRHQVELNAPTDLRGAILRVF